MGTPRQSDVASGFPSLQQQWQTAVVRLVCSGPIASAGLFVWRSPESSGMQKANHGGLAKCKIRKQIFWLPDLGSNQGPTD